MLSSVPSYGARPRQFFIDMNSFFASCEQQDRPELRGKPTIVVPMIADTTCALAASYEAKSYGIKTGTGVGEAKQICPHIQIVEARPRLYLEINRQILEVLNDHFVTINPLSVDEMACRLPTIVSCREEEVKIAKRVKEHMRKQLGPWLRCSIGIAPNVFLAKVASDCMKPDGLTIWDESNLPLALNHVGLRDLPGIGKAMQKRLAQNSIYSTEDLMSKSPIELRRAWGSVVGEQWWYMLRGSSIMDYAPSRQAGDVRKSVSQSHVLGPDNRTREGAIRVLIELTEKALKRIRTYNQAALHVSLSMRFMGRSSDGRSSGPRWQCHGRASSHASDDLTWMQVIRPLLSTVPECNAGFVPLSVGIVFSDLAAAGDVNLSLFDETVERQTLAETIDALNRKYSGAVALGRLASKRQVPLRIPFGTPEQPTIHPYS
jgi:DNA polymerase IV